MAKLTVNSKKAVIPKIMVFECGDIFVSEKIDSDDTLESRLRIVTFNSEQEFSIVNSKFKSISYKTDRMNAKETLEYMNEYRYVRFEGKLTFE